MELEKGFKCAKLVLDDPRDIFYAGQFISGHIECELIQPLQFSVINITFLGEATVFWTETEVEEYNGERRNLLVKYEGHEEYFNLTMTVAGGNGVSLLPAGPHKIPFRYRLPDSVPSSFNGERGKVKYSVTAFIDYPDARMERDKLIKVFEVIAPMDLNLANADIKQPIELEFEEVYSCCCSSSPMNISIRLPVSGFCPGQAIPITVAANNESSVEVKRIIFQLVQKECYHSQRPQSDYVPPEEVLETVKTSPILSNSKREFTYRLPVPAMVAPNLQNCRIIDVGFFLKVTIQLSGCNDDLEDESEICIGLVPLASTLNNEPYTHPMADTLPSAQIPAIVTEAQNNYVNNTAPPHSNGYPNPLSPYPNQMPHYPNQVSPYPNSQPPYPIKDSIPLMNMPDKIGFVLPPSSGATPYPGNSYPTGLMGNVHSSYPYHASPTAPSAPPPS